MSLREALPSFFKKLLGMRRICEDCNGRGKWQERIDDGAGMQHVETFYCETCHGIGIITNDDDIDDFDLGGVGTTEFDDEED